GKETVKVLDFGVSKITAPNDDPSLALTLTAPESIVGSPLYMSPEQLRDPNRVDARTDIWSLGVILFELATGRPPFPAHGPLGLSAAITVDATPSLSAAGRMAPAALEAIVRRCLEKSPEKRFASVDDLSRALDSFLADDATIESRTRQPRNRGRWAAVI